MLASQKYLIRERSLPIPIQQTLPTTMEMNSPKGEYSLKQNFFDPSKSSPPNDFMIKLNMRINKYYTVNNDDNLDIK
jgi:hypothetical protein